MSLSMIQLTPDIGRLIRWADARRLLPARGEDDLGYALHALLAASFGDHSPKPYALLRRPNRPAQLLGYTSASAHDLRAHAAAFAEPAAAAAIGLDTLAAKTMPTDWSAGLRLGFEVRVRPTIRTDRDGDRTKTRERDAFLVAINGTPPDGGPSRGDVYGAWLRQRMAAGGASLEQARLDSVRRTLVMRRRRNRDDGRRPLAAHEGPDATFAGVLKVRDPSAFGALVARGVGRHRAFGFGMLLLRPPD